MRKILIVFIIFCSVFLFGQTVSTHLSDTLVSMGKPVEYTLTVTNARGKSISTGPKGQLLPFHFEVLSDSIQNTTNIYSRKIKFQIFEEGKFVLPSVEVNVDGQILKTVPYNIRVVNSAKQGDQIHDIMNNKQVKIGFQEYWEMYKFYVLAIIAVVALIIAIIYFIKFGRRVKSSPKSNTNLFLKELDKLKSKKYIENNEYRLFYVELIDITRNFLAKQYQFPARELLTDDLIDFMKKENKISPENEKIVEDVFLRGDLVKFAKTIPTQQQMQEDFKNIKEFIQRSYKDIEFENLRKDV